MNPAAALASAAERQPRVARATAPERPARRVPGPPEHWQQFGVCLLFHFFVPLLPVLADAVAAGGRPSPSTLHLAASAYALSIGVSSRNVLSWGLFFVLGLVFAFSFGLSSVPAAAGLLGGSDTLPVGGIVLVFVIHLLERYNRHIVDREHFFPFLANQRTQATT